ncbi:MAG: FAD-dependent oxidoreductase [Minwuia sp.]|nr:FAD-dependent oxidoreductase [Minwuia sp.]
MAIGRDIYDAFPRYPVVTPPELSGQAAPAPVAIVGGGPIGLTLALGLASHGVQSVVIEPRDSASFGSRATCTSRRSLEIWWETLAGGIDQAGPGQEALFLAKLALLLGREIGDVATCQRLLETALEDLT